MREKQDHKKVAECEKPGDEQGNYESLPTHEGFGPYAPQHDVKSGK